MPGKIPVCRDKPSSAPYPSQDWRSCGKVLPCLGSCAVQGKPRAEQGWALGKRWFSRAGASQGFTGRMGTRLSQATH